jgi:hypothetical protein
MEGTRWRALIVVTMAACAVCAIALSGCGDNTTGTAVEAVVTDDPAVAFAPLVLLHPDETSFPIAADRFIERSSVKWAGSTCVGRANVATGQIAKRKTPGRVPPTDMRRLGGNPRPYVFESLRTNCKPRPRLYRSSELTRPYDSGRRAPGLPHEEGFYLDLLSDSKDGDPPLVRRGSERVLGDVPAYYEAEVADGRRPPGMRVTYWLLYGYGKALGRRGGELVGHEGDWQRVQVLLSRRGPRRWKPMSITLGSGRTARTVSWTELERSGSHPVVYSARESHALYTDSGHHQRRVPVPDGTAIAYDDTETCDDCLVWRTWRQLRPVDREPWYGFGGGWGFSDDADASSGPLGPYPRG